MNFVRPKRSMITLIPKTKQSPKRQKRNLCIRYIEREYIYYIRVIENENERKKSEITRAK